MYIVLIILLLLSIIIYNNMNLQENFDVLCQNKIKKNNDRCISKFDLKPYYCKYHDMCIKKYSKFDDDRYCGFYMLYDYPAIIYNSFEECNNNLNIYSRLNKNQCLKTSDAGWCTDYRGDGLCVPGTPEGPINQIRYNMCIPNQRSNKNSWKYYDKNLNKNII